MKQSLAISCMSCLMMLTGCSIEIPATNATAQMTSPTDIQNDPEASTAHPDGAGTWVVITANVAKKDIKRVARWEAYPHVHIVDCSSGLDINAGTEPRLGGIGFADADDVDRLLKAHPEKQSYEMRSLVFARPGDFHTPRCLQFQGGSYTGQKIVEARLPIRPLGVLP